MPRSKITEKKAKCATCSSNGLPLTRAEEIHKMKREGKREGGRLVNPKKFKGKKITKA